jgi:hypothetical protein
MGKEFESIHDAFTGRGRDVYILTPIMMHCTQRVSMLTVGSPLLPLSWFLVGDDFASWWSKSYFVAIHKTMEVRSGRELWMQSRGLQEI